VIATIAFTLFSRVPLPEAPIIGAPSKASAL
jgi:hypothetical protein